MMNGYICNYLSYIHYLAVHQIEVVKLTIINE